MVACKSDECCLVHCGKCGGHLAHLGVGCEKCYPKPLSAAEVDRDKYKAALEKIIQVAPKCYVENCRGCAYRVAHEALGVPLPEIDNSRRALVEGEGSWNLRKDDPRRKGAWEPGTISWEEHLEVWKAYAAKHGKEQDAERINQRGGFGKNEAELLLGRPLTTWKPRMERT